MTETQVVTRSAAIHKLRGRRAAEIKRRFCRRQADYLWGQRRLVTPEFVPWFWGDGHKIVGLRPIIVRRAWYVIAIDSRMEIGRPSGRFDEDDAFRELLDESIYPTLEDHFGMAFADDDEDDPVDVFAEWPQVNHEVGHEWFYLGAMP